MFLFAKKDMICIPTYVTNYQLCMYTEYSDTLLGGPLPLEELS